MWSFGIMITNNQTFHKYLSGNLVYHPNTGYLCDHLVYLNMILKFNKTNFYK